MTRTASLPMYDLPEVRPATDRLWSAVAVRLQAQGIGDVPGTLTRGPEPAVLWRDDRLLLSQTCGFPLTHAFADDLTPVAAPCYGVPGCTGPHYRSAVVVRSDDGIADLTALAGRRVAVNGWDSQSGWNALAAMVAPLATDGHLFSGAAVTGSHADSLAAVREGRADVAAIDCVTHWLLSRHRPAAVAGTRILTWTASAPGLPFVTRRDTPPHVIAILRTTLGAAIADPALAPVRDALGLVGIEAIGLDAFDRILQMADAAIAPPPVIAEAAGTG